jgi:membrane-associated phospholipid phosphatase
MLILLGAQVYIDRKKPAPEKAAKVWHWAVAVWVAFAVLMGIGRILTQRHWASDVYASWAVGLALACAMLLIAKVPTGVPGALTPEQSGPPILVTKVVHKDDGLP